MTRSLWIVFTLLLAACGACGANQFPDAVPTMSEPAVVKLTQVLDGKETGYCTGWKAGPDRIMTAGHCCDEGAKFLMTGPNAIPGEVATILHANEDQDSCVLKGKMKGSPLKIADRDPKVGEAVWTAGYPKTVFLISSGYWSGRDDEDRGIASVSVWGGASGSPIMNSKGEVVCLLVAYYPPMDTMAICTPVEWLKITYDMGNKVTK